MKLFNPCKHCLTRGICRERCEDLKQYGLTVHDTTYVMYMIVVVLISVSISYGLCMILPNTFVYGIIFTIISFGYYKVVKEIRTYKNTEWKEMYKWEKFVTCMAGPLFVFVSVTWDLVPVDNLINNYIYKYVEK